MRPIKTREEHQAALQKIAHLMKERPKSPRIELLAILIEAYEREHFVLEYPNALAAIRFRMEQQNLTQRDLVPYIGTRARVYEVLTGRRRLTLAMIRRLHAGLHIPAECLIR